MSSELPLPVKTYLEAINNRNVGALDACMMPDVRVNDLDDEQAAVGLEEVKQWFQDNCLHYNLQIEVTASRFAGDTFVVTNKTAGDFPGSPLLFDYRFSLVGDKIQNLDIKLIESPNLQTVSNYNPDTYQEPQTRVDSEMTLPEIIAALSTHDYTLPEAALNAAERRQEEITPILLATLEKYTAMDPGDDEANDNLALYAAYLLGKFRDIHALEIFGRIMDRVGDDWFGLDDLGIMDGGPRLFASWAYSNPEALKPFVENSSYADSVRGNAMEAFISLYLEGVVQPESMRSYLEHVYNNVLAHQANSKDGWVWYAWVRCCIDFGFDEFYPRIKEAFAKEWIDPTISSWDFEETNIAKGREHILKNARQEQKGLIGHVADELRNWYCFTESARKEHEKWETRDAAREYIEKMRAQRLAAQKTKSRDFIVPAGTIVNAQPKTKPNQPCPCGSGKKYKKCCGRSS